MISARPVEGARAFAWASRLGLLALRDAGRQGLDLGARPVDLGLGRVAAALALLDERREVGTAAGPEVGAPGGHGAGYEHETGAGGDHEHGEATAVQRKTHRQNLLAA